MNDSADPYGAIYSPGVIRGKKTVSGTAMVYDQYPGTSDPTTGSAGGQSAGYGKALPAAGSGIGENFKGATVYAQWFEKPSRGTSGDNPAVASPVYKTTVDENGEFAINMRPFIDSEGNYREFYGQYNIAAGGRGQKVKIWVDGYDRNEYEMLVGYGARPAPDGTVTDISLSADWRSGGLDQNVFNVHQLFVKRSNAEKMLGDESQWHKMTDVEKAANGKDGGSLYGKAYWNYNTGTTSTFVKSMASASGDRRVEGMKVVAAYLSDAAIREIQKHVEENKGTLYQNHSLRGTSWDVNDELKLQEWINEQIAQHPDWIAERVVTETDGNGDYLVQFKGTYGIGPNNPGKVAPERAGTVAAEFSGGYFSQNQASLRGDVKHVNWDWMFVDTPDLPHGVSNMGAWRGNVWQGLTAAAWGVSNIATAAAADQFDMRATQAVLLNANYNLSSWDMVLMPNKINFAVDKYDSLTNFARPGDSTHAFTQGLPAFESGALYQVEWTDQDGNVINTCKAVDAEGNLVDKEDSLGMPAKSDGSLPNCEITVPKDLDKMMTYTATLYGIDADGNRKRLAADSFTALVKTASEVTPEYDPTFAEIGKETPTGKPHFTDSKTGEPIDPSDERLQGAEYQLHKSALPDGWTAEIDSATGVITVTPGPNGIDGEELKPGDKVNLPVRVKYADGSANGVYAPIVIGKQADFFDPKYEEGKGKPGENATVPAPKFTDKDGKETTPPADTKFTPGENAPDGLKVDEKTGKVTVPVPADKKPGEKFTVPVEVTYPDGSKDNVDVTVTVEEPAPSIVPGTATDVVPADNKPKSLDDKVKNPTEGMTGEVLDKDGNPIQDAKVEVDPNTGEIKVTVPEGTKPQDGKVVVKDKDGNKVGEIDIKIVDPRSDAAKFVPNYGDATKVEAGKTEQSKKPFGEADAPVKAAKSTPSEGSEDWKFETSQTDGVVTATSPTYEKVGEKIAEKMPELQKTPKKQRWDQFVKEFTPFAKPDVSVEFEYEDGTSNSAKAGFDLVGKDGKSLLDPDGDFDGDGKKNREEIEKGSNPADETSTPDETAPTIDNVTEGDKQVKGKDDRPNSSVTVEFPDGTKKTVPTDENGNWTVDVPAGMELKPGGKIKVTDEAGNPSTAEVRPKPKDGEGEDQKTPGDKPAPAPGDSLDSLDFKYPAETNVKPGTKGEATPSFTKDGKDYTPKGINAQDPKAEGATDWQFGTNGPVVTGQAPSMDQLTKQFTGKYGQPDDARRKLTFEQFTKDFGNVANPLAKFGVTDGKTTKPGEAQFRLVGQDGKSILDPSGDFDGDGVPNGKEIEKGLNPFDPKENGFDAGRCAASAVGFGLPLIALLPLGLASQIQIPVLSDVAAQVDAQLKAVNTRIQQQAGIFNPEMARQAEQINAQLRTVGADLGMVAAGIVLIAAGILAGTIIYDNCKPGGPSSSVKDLELQGSSGKTVQLSSKKEQK